MTAPSRRRRPASPESPADSPAGTPIDDAPPAADHRPKLLFGCAVALVAQPILASESSSDGDGLLLVALWFFLLLGAGFWAASHRPPRRFLWVDGFAALLIGWTALSALVALASGPPYRSTLNVAWEWGAFGAAYATLRLLGPNAREARALATVMIAVTTISAAYGLYQYFIELPATRRLFESAPDQQAFMIASGLSIEKGTPAWDAYLRRLNSVEPFATFALANSLAGLLVPWLTVLVGVVLAYPRTEKTTNTAARIGAIVALLVVAACLVLTKSRTGWVAAAAGVGLVATVFRGRAGSLWPTRTVLAVAAAAAVALVGFMAWRGGLDLQVLTEAGKSLSYRFQYWEGAAGVIGENPLLGCGVGRFGDEYTRFKGETASEEIQDPHNLLVEVWATAGTPAALGMLGIVGWLLVQGFRFANSTETTLVPPPAGAAPPRDGVTAIALGGLLGVAAGWIARISIYSPLEFTYLLLAIPTATALWYSLKPWIDDGAPVGGWWVAALAAWGLNLTIAGGVGYPGVAGGGWLLLALTTSLVERRRRAAVFPVWLGGAIAATAGILLAACHLTAYQPVSSARTITAELVGLDRPPPEQVPEIIAQAIQADPYDWRFRQQAADLALAYYLAEPSPERLLSFEQWQSSYMQYRGECASSWVTTALWFRRIWQQTGEASFGRRALTAQREAVKWYPNSPVRWADLAVLEEELGEHEAARASAKEALRLDAATPHSDKKLSDELRQRVERIASGRTG